MANATAERVRRKAQEQIDLLKEQRVLYERQLAARRLHCEPTEACENCLAFINAQIYALILFLTDLGFTFDYAQAKLECNDREITKVFRND